MGSCLSRGDGLEAERDVEGEGTAGIPTGGNKPLIPHKSIVWSSDAPITRQELHRQREAFWDTSPAYSGRAEVWQALRAACESQSLELAQAIIDSANVTVPTGSLCDGCYDELGNSYVIPALCIVDPKNLIRDRDKEKDDSETISDVKLDQAMGSGAAGGPTMELVARLSTGKDLKLAVTKKDTVASVKRLVEAQSALDGQRSIRIFYFGRQLDEQTMIGDLKLSEGGIIQVFCG
ncbi:Ubiquitin domain-containing protein 2 [Gaertneriomyces sp. JEL0708]|nr:Ubiquitin domain-containing protein 2 [Gaertneriomyces sp. JEL0708]